MPNTKLVYMCPLCRNRIEYDIKSVTMYTHEKKNVDGNIELVEKEHHITSAAIVTTISPLKCKHTKSFKDHKVYPIESMIPVPEWVPDMMDELIKTIPDACNFTIPKFRVSEEVESTCSLALTFKTFSIDVFIKFMEIASILIEKDINGYGSYLKVHVSGSRFPKLDGDGNKIELCSINVIAPNIDFMSANEGKGKLFYRYIKSILDEFNKYDQMRIGDINEKYYL